jgi:hypothetical protein
MRRPDFARSEEIRAAEPYRDTKIDLAKERRRRRCKKMTRNPLYIQMSIWPNVWIAALDIEIFDRTAMKKSKS